MRANFVFVDYPAPDKNVCGRFVHDNTECPSGKIRRNVSQCAELHHVKPLGAVVLHGTQSPNNTESISSCLVIPSYLNGLSLSAGLCTPRPPRFNTCV